MNATKLNGVNPTPPNLVNLTNLGTIHGPSICIPRNIPFMTSNLCDLRNEIFGHFACPALQNFL